MRHVFLAGLSLTALFAAPVAAQVAEPELPGEEAKALEELARDLPFERLVVLGDSASDAGNLQALLAPFADPTPAALGYVDGRFTNGFAFADNIALRLQGSPTLGSLAGGDNYAFGGATIVTDVAVGNPLTPIPPVVPDFTQQVDFYLSNGVDPNALHLLQIGNNDTIVTSIGFAPLEPTLAAISESFGAGLDRLIEAGARDFAIATTFAANEFPTSGAVEQAFIDAARARDSEGDGLQFYVLDVASVVSAINDDPAAFGIDPALVGTPCFFVPGATPECEGFRTVDGIHETADLFDRIASEMVIALVDQYRAPRNMLALTEEAALRGSARLDRLSALAPHDLEQGTWGLVGEMSWNAVDRHGDDAHSAFDADGIDIAAGLFGRLDSSITIGAGAFYAERDISIGTGLLAADAEASEFGGFVQLAYEKGRLDLAATATLSKLDLDDYARPLGDGRIARAASEGDGFSAALEAGYDIGSGATRIRPFVRIAHVSVDYDDIAESGASGLTALNNRHEGLDASLTIASGGIAMATPIGSGASPFRLGARAAYDHAIEDFDQLVTSELAAFPGLGREVVGDPIDGWGRLELTLEKDVGNATAALRGRYRGDFSDYDDLSVSAFIRLRF